MARSQFNRQAVISAMTSEEMKMFSSTSAANVAIGGSEVVTLFATAGRRCELNAIYLRAASGVAGATGGTHSIWFFVSNGSVALMWGKSAFGAEISYSGSEWNVAAAEQYPTDKGAQALVVKGVGFDDVYGLSISYNNNTDAASVVTRSIRILYVERVVA